MVDCIKKTATEHRSLKAGNNLCKAEITTTAALLISTKLETVATMTSQSPLPSSTNPDVSRLIFKALLEIKKLVTLDSPMTAVTRVVTYSDLFSSDLILQ